MPLRGADLAALEQLVGRLHRRRLKPAEDGTRLSRLRQFENPTEIYHMLALGDRVARTVQARNTPSRRDPDRHRPHPCP